MQVTFYGVRGSCPCAGDTYNKYGGNTACMLVEIDGDPPLIVDLGTGLRALGQDMAPVLAAEGRALQANALLSHLHYDHILGLPFFGPLTDPRSRLDIYGPNQPDGTLREVLPKVVKPPFFPVHLMDFEGEICLRDIGDEDFAVGSAKVRSRSIPHVGHTLGFRLEADGASLAYLSDHQAPTDGCTVAATVLELCDGVDLVIHDAQYTTGEFVDKGTWGHSTVDYAVRVAAEAGARRLLMYHHDPAHEDADIDAMLAWARSLPEARRLEDVSASNDGMVLTLAGS